MTTRVIKLASDRDALIELIKSHKMPFTANITKGKPRSIEQNRLQRMWLLEAAEQLGEDRPEGYRAYCKLHFGVPILRGENEQFHEVYDRLIRPRSYEEKLELMAVPMDMPVTRIMTIGQKKRYLDDMHQHFTKLGVQLTEPE